MEKYKRNPNVECAICKKAIYRKPSQIKRNSGQAFCGLACYGVSSRKEKPCPICGKMVMAKFNKKTCSRMCSNKYREGIKYKIGRPRDKVVQIRSIKLRLFETRGQACERCGYKKFEILHVHHKDRNRKNNEFQNLELICPNCHYEEHFLEKSWLTKLT